MKNRAPLHEVASSAPDRQRPNLLIVGAARCGTTSLYRYLSEHPEVFMSAVKEPNFFCGNHPEGTWPSYMSLFNGVSDERVVGEASPSYLSDPRAAHNIARRLGTSVTALAILRNPIDMIHSRWGHMTHAGVENRPFMQAVRGDGCDYVERARYYSQVKRYFHALGPSRLVVLIFEEFFAAPAAGFSALCARLGIGTDFSPAFIAHNSAANPRSPLLASMMAARPTARRLRWLLPSGAYMGLRAVRRRLLDVNSTESARPPLSEVERRHLWALVDSDVRKLSGLLERDLERLWAPTHVAAR